MNTKYTLTDDVLFGRVRSRVLALLFQEPEESHYLREIARHVQTSAGNVRRELIALGNIGLVERTDVGNQAHFRANRKHPAFSEMRALLAKTVGVFHLLNAALVPAKDRIDFAFVYGSFAEGTEKPASDVDLLLVGEISLDELLELMDPVEKQLGRPIHPAIYTLEDFCGRLRAGNHFLRSLQGRKKVYLIGDEDGFAGACANRLVQT